MTTGVVLWDSRLGHGRGLLGGPPGVAHAYIDVDERGWAHRACERIIVLGGTDDGLTPLVPEAPLCRLCVERTGLADRLRRPGTA